MSVGSSRSRRCADVQKSPPRPVRPVSRPSSPAAMRPDGYAALARDRRSRSLTARARPRAQAPRSVYAQLREARTQLRTQSLPDAPAQSVSLPTTPIIDASAPHTESPMPGVPTGEERPYGSSSANTSPWAAQTTTAWRGNGPSAYSASWHANRLAGPQHPDMYVQTAPLPATNRTSSMDAKAKRLGRLWQLRTQQHQVALGPEQAATRPGQLSISRQQRVMEPGRAQAKQPGAGRDRVRMYSSDASFQQQL